MKGIMVDGKTGVVVYDKDITIRYIRNRNADGTLASRGGLTIVAINANPALTIMGVADHPNVTVIGYAKCNSLDNFCKHIGRDIAMNRAFGELERIFAKIALKKKAQ